MSNSNTKIDIDKLIEQSYEDMNFMRNIKTEDLDLSQEYIKALLLQLDELEQFALRTKEMMCKNVIAEAEKEEEKK